MVNCDGKHPCFARFLARRGLTDACEHACAYAAIYDTSLPPEKRARIALGMLKRRFFPEDISPACLFKLPPDVYKYVYAMSEPQQSAEFRLLTPGDLDIPG
jgi:hypothetical protein